VSVLLLNLFRLFYLELRKSGKAETGHRSAPRYVWPVFTLCSIYIYGAQPIYLLRFGHVNATNRNSYLNIVSIKLVTQVKKLFLN